MSHGVAANRPRASKFWISTLARARGTSAQTNHGTKAAAPILSGKRMASGSFGNRVHPVAARQAKTPVATSVRTKASLFLARARFRTIVGNITAVMGAMNWVMANPMNIAQLYNCTLAALPKVLLTNKLST